MWSGSGPATCARSGAACALAAGAVADAIPNSRPELLDAGHGPWLGHPETGANPVDAFVSEADSG